MKNTPERIMGISHAKKQIIIVGGGPAGLMAADVLSPFYVVGLYDKEISTGKKFLLAGKGNFNITNNAQGGELKNAYSPAGFLDTALSDFDTKAFRQWLSALNIPTFVGTSGRVFPEKGIRPMDVLNAIKSKLVNQGVLFFPEHEFVRVTDRGVVFKNQEKEVVCEPDYCIFALGGASWPATGSNGLWRTAFESMGIATHPFQSSNCGINIPWPESVRIPHAGKPFKNVMLFAGNAEATGEFVLTDYGMEGNAVYRLVPAIRKMLNAKIPALIQIDFKPLNTREQLLQKVKGAITTKDYGKVFNLTTSQLALIKAFSDREGYQSVDRFAGLLKKLTIPVDSLRPVAEAISTVGGIDTLELNDDFSLRKFPWMYAIGEMVDWDAPTGGYLLQGCFSMGHHAARSIIQKEECTFA